MLTAADIKRAGGDPSGWFIPPWTLQGDQQVCKDNGIKTAILSLTAPGPAIEKDPKAAAALARQCNEICASLRDERPSEYGFFLSVPDLLNTQACLDEIGYGLDTLHADGVVLMSRYSEDNHYLGHPDFRPVWAELNRRKAIVFIHPTHPVDVNLVDSHLPQPMFDYPHETGRTAIDMIVSGTMASVPDCKIILSHAGGTLPYLIYRVAMMMPYTPFAAGKSGNDILEEARRFYYDTALSSNPLTMNLLFQFLPPGHILYGSDFPNAPKQGILDCTKALNDFPMDDVKRKEIDNGAALNLFPRLNKM